MAVLDCEKRDSVADCAPIGKAVALFALAVMVFLVTMSAYQHFCQNWWEPDFGSRERSFIFSLIASAVVSLQCGTGYLVALSVCPRMPRSSTRDLLILSVVLGLLVYPVDDAVGKQVDMLAGSVVRAMASSGVIILAGPVVLTGLACLAILRGLKWAGWLWPRKEE